MELAELDPWLARFLDAATRDTITLRRNGAEDQARAREVLLEDLVDAAARHYREEIGTSEAAEVLDVSPETVRRRVRAGKIEATRTDDGAIRIRRGELNRDRHDSDEYNPSADARAILSKL